MENKFPARLHVVYAKNKRVGVVFRRGPSNQVATYLWDMETDTFTLGQWLKGRIYERRSDLSHDGKYLIYFAMNGRWDTKVKGAWTAVSVAPWLTAINLYAKGDCWNGGGLFTSNNTFWLNGGIGVCRHTKLHESKNISIDNSGTYDNCIGNDECLGVYYNRLIRDGWKIVKYNKFKPKGKATIFEKPLDYNWFLIKIAHENCDSPVGNGCYWDEHILYNKTTKQSIVCTNFIWADKDYDSLIWAEDGSLYRVMINKDMNLNNSIKLYDFNACKFKAIKSPYVGVDFNEKDYFKTRKLTGNILVNIFWKWQICLIAIKGIKKRTISALTIFSSKHFHKS